MRAEVDGADAVRREAEHLLRKAAVKGRLPTPVDDIIAAAGLIEAKHSLLSSLVLDQAPAHLRRAARKVTLKIRALLDRREREIHIDPAIHNRGQIVFKKLHEVSHDIFPWQRALAYADDDMTLSWTTRVLFERQANQGAAELLFQRDLFSDMARQYEINIASILELAGLIGASGHAAFRRFIETHRATVGGLVMDLSPCSTDPIGYRRYEVVGSDTWIDQFGSGETWPRILHSPPYTFVDLAAVAQRKTSPVRDVLTLPDISNAMVNLNVEVYSNQYRFFVLMSLPKRQRLRHRRIIVPASAQRATA